MTLQTIPPSPLWDTTMKQVGYASILLDAANEKAAYIVQAPKSGTIDRVCFRSTTVTAAEAAALVRVETVVDGTPSGTLFGTNTSGTANINASDTWYEVTLTAGAAVTKGDWLAVVVALPVGTSGNLNLARGNQAHVSRPYVAHFTAAWSKITAPPIGALRYNDASYPHIPGLLSFDSLATGTFQTATNPDERGNKITVPFACKVWGIWQNGVTSDGDFTVKLYDDADTVLSDLAVDGDHHSDTAAVSEFIGFDNEVTLAAGDVVRLTLLATAGTSTALVEATCPSGLSAALPGGGQMVYTTRNDGGAWTDTTGKVAFLGLIVSALSDGAGGGTTQGNLGSVLRGVAH